MPWLKVANPPFERGADAARSFVFSAASSANAEMNATSRLNSSSFSTKDSMRSWLATGPYAPRTRGGSGIVMTGSVIRPETGSRSKDVTVSSSSLATRRSISCHSAPAKSSSGRTDLRSMTKSMMSREAFASSKDVLVASRMARTCSK